MFEYGSAKRRMVHPMSFMIISPLWILISLYSLDQVGERVAKVRTIGEPVDTYLYGLIGLYTVSAAFWLWMGVSAWKQYRGAQEAI